MATGFELNDLLEQARSRWLEPAEVLFILQNHDGDMIKNRVPQQPTSGSVIFYDKNITPSFRRDGYNWCKKPNKNTVNEGHEKLKVGGVEVIDCYYAKREENHDFMRRSYWMLDRARKHIVLVHCRDITEGKTNTESIVKFSAGQSCTFQEDLASQVADLKRENSQILSAMSVTTQQFLNVEAGNSVLRAQMAELSHRLDSLNEILDCINSSSSGGYGGGGLAGPALGAEMMMMGGGGDGFVGSPWNLGWMMNQPIMASSVDYHHDFGY